MQQPKALAPNKIRPASAAAGAQQAKRPAPKKSKPSLVTAPTRDLSPPLSDSISPYDYPQDYDQTASASPSGPGEGAFFTYPPQLPSLRDVTGHGSSWAPPRGRHHVEESQYELVQELESYPRPSSSRRQPTAWVLDAYGQPQPAYYEDEELEVGEPVPVPSYEQQQQQQPLDWSHSNLPPLPEERTSAHTDPGDRSPSPVASGYSSAPPSAVPGFLSTRSHSYTTSSPYARHHASTVSYEPVEVEEARVQQEQQVALQAANAAYHHVYGDEELEIPQSTPYISSAAGVVRGAIEEGYPSPTSYGPPQGEWAPAPSSGDYYRSSGHQSFDDGSQQQYVDEEPEYHRPPSTSTQVQFHPHQLHPEGPSPAKATHSPVAPAAGRGMHATLGHALPPHTSPLLEHQHHSASGVVGHEGSPNKLYVSTSSPRLPSLSQHLHQQHQHQHEHHSYYVSPPTSHLSAPSTGVGVGGVPGFSTLISHSSPRQHYLSVPSVRSGGGGERYSFSNLTTRHEQPLIYEQPHQDLHRRQTSEEEVPRAAYEHGEEVGGGVGIGLGIVGAGEMEGSLREAHEERWTRRIEKAV